MHFRSRATRAIRWAGLAIRRALPRSRLGGSSEDGGQHLCVTGHLTDLMGGDGSPISKTGFSQLSGDDIVFGDQQQPGPLGPTIIVLLGAGEEYLQSVGHPLAGSGPVAGVLVPPELVHLVGEHRSDPIIWVGADLGIPSGPLVLQPGHSVVTGTFLFVFADRCGELVR